MTQRDGVWGVTGRGPQMDRRGLSPEVGSGLAGPRLGNVSTLTGACFFPHTPVSGLKSPHLQAALKQEAQGKKLLIQTQNSSLDPVSKVISGESGGKMTKLGWLLYLFGFEWSVGSDPVLLFLAGCGTKEDSKQWGDLALVFVLPVGVLPCLPLLIHQASL